MSPFYSVCVYNPKMVLMDEYNGSMLLDNQGESPLAFFASLKEAEGYARRAADDYPKCVILIARTIKSFEHPKLPAVVVKSYNEDEILIDDVNPSK